MLRPSGRIYFCYTTRSATDWLSRSDASCSASFQIVRFSACDSIPTARYLASLVRSIVTIIVNDAAAAFSRRVENRTIHIRQKIPIHLRCIAYHGTFLSIVYPPILRIVRKSHDDYHDYNSRIWSNLEKKLQRVCRKHTHDEKLVILCRVPRNSVLSSYICTSRESIQRWIPRNEINENDKKSSTLFSSCPASFALKEIEMLCERMASETGEKQRQ